ncbi:hypothetical protein LSPH24S_04767 [Lysinibacillus sphaericus]
MWSSIFRLPSHFKGEAAMEQQSTEFLKIFGLDIYKNELAKNLPYGMQRRLEIARALAANPKLLKGSLVVCTRRRRLPRDMRTS